MEYKDDQALLREFIRESMGKIDERLTSAGGFEVQGTDGGEGGAPAGFIKFPTYSDRWGWVEPAEEAESWLLRLLGLPASVEASWDSVIDLFTTTKKMITDTGRWFIEILTKSTSPSRSRKSGWFASFFPKTSGWMSGILGAATGKSTKGRFSWKLFEAVEGESKDMSDASVSDFLSFLSDDLDIISLQIDSIKDADDLLSVVREWRKLVPSSGTLESLEEALKGMGSWPKDVVEEIDLQLIARSFVNDVARPFMKNVLSTIARGINSEWELPPSAQAEVASLFSRAIQKI